MSQEKSEIVETNETPAVLEPWVVPAMSSLNASATEFNPGPFGDAEGAS